MNAKMRSRIDIRRGLAAFERSVGRLHRDQIPFAASMALNAVAARVAAAEVEELAATFNTPTAFTLRGMGVLRARKTSLTATVFVKDKQAAYLAPFMPGGSGRQVLGSKRAILAPRGVGLNAFGNIPRGKLAALKRRSDVFIGPVTLKGGRTINGVWQRPGAVRRGTSRRKVAATPAKPRALKLLIEFDNPKPVRQRLPYGARAAEVVAKHMHGELTAALEQALATRR